MTAVAPVTRPADRDADGAALPDPAGRTRTGRPRPSPAARWRSLGGRRQDLVLAGTLAALALVTRAWNVTGYPRWFTDEGVYVAQAWAVQTEHQLAPYTYWYDHPPLGWVQVALWSVLSGAGQRNSAETIVGGRELMVLVAAATVALMYVVARRLGWRRWAATAAGLVWIASPLALTFGRYVLLDNIAVVWVLAAMALALSPRRSLWAAAAGGACLGIAILSKETAALLAPAVVYLLWRTFRDALNRGYALIVSVATTVLLCLLYPLYALLKGELVPGPGHVSLWQGQVAFQLASRAGSGSIFDSGSDARLLIDNAWLGLDAWLPLAGLVLLLPSFAVPRLRGPALALGAQVAILLKGGYLPYPFVIGTLPFCALLVAGWADVAWPRRLDLGSARARLRTVAGVGLVAALASSAVVVGGPRWPDTLRQAYTSDATAVQRQALDWADRHLPHDSQIVTEGELWLDLRRRGFDNPEVIWTYKVDTDPAVRTAYGNDISGLDYLVVNKSTLDASGNAYPTISAAARHSTEIARFGTTPLDTILVLRPDNASATE